MRRGSVPPIGEAGRLGPAWTDTLPRPHSQRAERPQGALPSVAILTSTHSCRCTKALACKGPAGFPLREARSPALRRYTVARHPRTSCVSVPRARLRFPPLLLQAKGHAHWRAQVPRPLGPSRCPDWLDKVLKSQWRSRLPLATPLPRRGRATAPSLRCALQAPRPLRARCSLRPLPPVTCAARMWLGADVGSRCGPGPAHPRGRSAHTEPRRARRLSRLPQCTVELRPPLAGVVPNVAARYP